LRPALLLAHAGEAHRGAQFPGLRVLPACDPKIYREGYTIAINGTESGVDDPDQHFYETFVCGAMRNYTGYCNPEVDKLIDQQSAEPDREKRKQLVWQNREAAGRGRRPTDYLLSAWSDLHANPMSKGS
jgi:hypothetical protein